jgi:lycopene beta-cyclase
VCATSTLERPRQRKPIEYYVREPKPWPKDVPIQEHDLVAAPFVDLVVAGAGPSGLSVAERVARAGYKVCVVDPDPLGIWPNNYGVWVDEFEAMGLEECLEVVWPKAKVWLTNSPEGEKCVGRGGRAWAAQAEGGVRTDAGRGRRAPWEHALI